MDNRSGRIGHHHTRRNTGKNILPIGQALWLKELQTYQTYPPMQDPSSYNLSQVMDQLKKPSSGPGQ